MTGKITRIVGGSVTKQEDSASMRMHGHLKILLSRAGVLQQRKLADECTELVSFFCLCHIRVKCKQRDAELCSPAARLCRVWWRDTGI